MSKSRGSTVSGKIALASSRSTETGYRVVKCVRASILTCASCAIAAACPAVEWPVSAARAVSSSAKVASWINTSAPWAAIWSVSHGVVSPEITNLRPARAVHRGPAPARPR